MKVTHKSLKFVGLAFLLASLIVGCGGSDGKKLPEPTPAPAPAPEPDPTPSDEEVAEATDKAIDTQVDTIAEAATQNVVTIAKGYVEVCDDLYDENGNKGVSIGQGKFIFSKEPVASITATGCIDPVTNVVVNDLKTPSGKRVISPITTLVVDLEGDEEAIKAFIGGDVTNDELYEDPIALAATKPALLNKAIVVSSIVIVGSADGTKTAQEISENLSATLKTNAEALKSGTTVDINAEIETATGVPKTLIVAATEAATALSSTPDATSAAKIEGVLKAVSNAVKSGSTTAVTADDIAADAETESENLTAAVTTIAEDELATAVKTKVKEIVTAIVEGNDDSGFVSEEDATSIADTVKEEVDNFTTNYTGASGG